MLCYVILLFIKIQIKAISTSEWQMTAIFIPGSRSIFCVFHNYTAALRSSVNVFLESNFIKFIVENNASHEKLDAKIWHRYFCYFFSTPNVSKRALHIF